MTKRWFSSELIAWAMERAGIKFDPPKNRITPAELIALFESMEKKEKED